jgi:hypothetical protein
MDTYHAFLFVVGLVFMVGGVVGFFFSFYPSAIPEVNDLIFYRLFNWALVPTGACLILWGEI